MPIINGVKYACEPCMRGHRSSKCTHDDRLLVRVRKPGRPLSSCPHLPSGPGGVATFVDANGARLDSSPAPHNHHAGQPCGCEVTSLAIPKISACACSHTRSPLANKDSPSIAPISLHPPLPGGFNNHGQISTPASTVSSLQMSPISPGSVYSSATDASAGRRPRIHKKRKSISVNGEAILDLAARHNGITNMPTVGIAKHNTQEQQVQNMHANGERRNSATFRDTQSWDTTGIAREHGGLSNDEMRRTGILAASDERWSGNDWENKVDVSHTHLLKTNGATSHRVHHESSHNENHFVAPKQNSGCGGCKSKSASTMTQSSGMIPATALQQYAAMGQFRPTHPFNYQSPPVSFPTYHDQMQQMQPIATTIYTYPNGYTTVNNPLTSQELAMLQSSGAWLSPAAAAAWSGNPTGAASVDAAHSCSCGPGCECLGCAAHPFNANTVNFVKDMRTMMYSHNGKPHRRKRFDDASAVTAGRKSGGCCGSNSGNRSLNSPNIHGTTGHHSEHSPAVNNSMDFTSMSMQSLGSPALHPLHVSDSPLSTQKNSAASSPMLDSSQSLRAHHCRPVTSTNMSSPAYTSGSSPDALPNDDETETEQQSVSPSAYFHIDYPLGLCSETDMGCMCGDDCTCIGCLIHGNNLSMPPQHNDTDMTNGIHHANPISQEPLISAGTALSSNTGGCCGKGKPKPESESSLNFDTSTKTSNGVAHHGNEGAHILGQNIPQQLNPPPSISNHFQHHKSPSATDGLSAYAWG